MRWPPPGDPAIPYVYRCWVIKVIDGDTIDLRIDVGFHLAGTHRIRLLGLDAPEVRGTERAEGLKATQWVKGWFATYAAEELVVRTHKSDSFGRWLGDIYTASGHHLNQDMLDAGFATPYQP